MSKAAIPMALGVTGAVISTYLGAGPAVGFMAGSTLGTLFFGPGSEDVSQTGPRLQDLTVTSSAYGRTIPIILGTARIGGNVVVSSDKIETSQVESQGKGGMAGMGGSAEFETFHYRVHFFWAACRGDGSQKLLKVYADKKLIFDATTAAITSQNGALLGGQNVVRPDFEIRWRPGGADQIVDPKIEDIIGEDNSPAYRQLAGILFEDFKLDRYGNRVPQIEAVISSTADDDYPQVDISFDNVELDSRSQTSWAVDWKRGRWYNRDGTGTQGWHIMSTETMAKIAEVTDADFNLDIPEGLSGTNIGPPLGINPFDHSLVANASGGNTSPVIRIDGDSYRMTHQFGESGLGVVFTPTAFQTLRIGACAGTYSKAALPGFRTFFVCAGVLGTEIGILDADDMTYVFDVDLDDVAGSTVGQAQLIIPVTPQEDNAICYVICAVNSGNYALFKFTMHYSATYASPGFGHPNETFGVLPELVKLFDTATYTGGSNLGVSGMWWDPADDTLMIQWGNGISGAYMIKYDQNEDTVVWSQEYTGGHRSHTGTLGCQYDVLKDNKLGWVNQTSLHTMVIDTRDGEIIWETTNTNAGNWLTALVYQQSYNSAENSIIGIDIGKIYLQRIAGDEITLQAAVETILDYAGYESTEYDMSAFSGITFPGYILSRPSNARQFLEQLSSAFFFSIVESDYVLKGVLKSNPTTVAVTQDDLGEVSGDLKDVPLTIDRIQEEELPGEVTLLHSEPERDYQTGTQHVRRGSLPELYTMQSDHNMVVTLPLMIDADEARQIAEKMMFTSWVERNLYQLVLPWKYLALDPADVVNLTMDDGSTHSIRAIQVDIGANMTIEVRGVSNDTPSFTSNISGNSGEGFKDKTLFTTAPTDLLVMQTPLLRDEDDLNRTGTVFYTAAGARSAAWTGAFLYESTDGSSYNQIATFVVDATWGATIGTLAAPELWNVFDNVNTIDVRVNNPNGSLSSVTYDALFASDDVNACLIGDEVVRFMTATDNGDGTYTLSGLLRGRRGTDYAVDQHANGERFVLLTEAALSIIEKGLSAIGESRYYKGVSVGESLEDPITIPVTMQGADLKPYAPENIQRDDDGSAPDIVVTWTRRTRIDNEFRDGEDPAPLNEDTEAYAAYILSAAYDPDTFDASDSSTYVRAYTGLTSETFTYTDAEQTTDGFDKAIDTLYVVIFQVSTQVGNGWPGDAALYAPDAQYYTILGENGLGSTSGANWESNNTLWQQYTASKTGEIEYVDVYFSDGTSAANIRVGVYADSGDLPDTLSSSEDSSVGSSHTVGFHRITLTTPVAVTEGDKFWLAVQVDTTKPGAAGSPVVTSIQRQRSGLGYASGMPDPAGSTATYGTNRSVRCVIHVGV